MATAWQHWLLIDQRFVADRPDVLTYVTPPLTGAAAHRRRADREPDRVHQRHATATGWSS